ncbi:MAG: hypothetical protein OEM46_00225 [Ignavibacteria bacterium]|nr:hypothetical protein [Ignavibacteria bacterium]
MKKTKLLLTTLIILLITFWGCSSDNPTEPSPNQGTQAPLSKLSDIQAKVFRQSCALSSCHGSTNNQANLLLTNGNSFNNLVSVQSLLFPQFERVVPDSSSKSLLIKILKGEVSPRMPFNRDPLSAAIIDSIAKWIDNGALNN